MLAQDLKSFLLANPKNARWVTASQRLFFGITPTTCIQLYSVVSKDHSAQPVS